MSKDNRLSPRVRTEPINVRIQCHVGSIPAYISNLSDRGARIHLEEKLEDNNLTLIIPMIDENEPPLEIKSECVRAEQDKEYHLNIIGVLFTEISQAQKDKIIILMEHHRKNKAAKS
ncbi:MAG: PilZ domain-containing protein [Spirochaetota bacterium]|nr:PilZ domain-containing protein [Spirochaetota bacterium]